MSQIKAIIADVDGVMVGKDMGVNFPLPHRQVMQALKQTAAAGTPIILCTAKSSFAIQQIAVQANLNNPHITDGGAVIINLVNDTVTTQHTIDKKAVKAIVSACVEADIYVELYGINSYYVQSSQTIAFTKTRSEVLQREPTIVPSLLDIANQQTIIKLVVFVLSEAESVKLEKIVKSVHERIHFIWSFHPYLVPRRPGVITANNVSKAEAAKVVVAQLGLTFDDILGIGDSKSDWNFMELCKYVASVSTEENELQALVQTKGEGNYYIASSVDDHGLLEILNYFKLI